MRRHPPHSGSAADAAAGINNDQRNNAGVNSSSSSSGSGGGGKIASPTTASAAAQQQHNGQGSTLLLLFCAAGVNVFYLLYGILQEKMLRTNTTPYGDDNAHFSATLSLLVLACSVNAVAAAIALKLQGATLAPPPWNSPPLHSPEHNGGKSSSSAAALSHDHEKGAHESPTAAAKSSSNKQGLGRLWERLLYRLPPRVANYVAYAPMGASSIIAMLSSNLALRYVNFPTQVLGKSCKMVPVILGGALIARKKYPLRKWIAVTLVTVGIAAFMLFKSSKGGGHKKHGGDAAAVVVEETSWEDTLIYLFGLALVFLSLAMDGVIGGLQESMNSKRERPSSQLLMFMLNGWSALLVFPVALLTGDLFSFIAFCWTNPAALWDVAGFSLTSAAGQFFVFTLIARFSPLTCTTITTTRKFFGIIVSVFLFGHNLNTLQWISAVLVFVGLTVDMTGKSSGGHHGGRTPGESAHLDANAAAAASSAAAGAGALVSPARIPVSGIVSASGTPMNSSARN